MFVFSKLTAIAVYGLAFGGLVSVALAAPHKPAAAQTASKAEFDQALDDYRQGRQTAAYGTFTRLADAGDVEAARIALILLRHGERLHGAAWGASQPQINHWMKLARQPMAPLAAESGD